MLDVDGGRKFSQLLKLFSTVRKRFPLDYHWHIVCMVYYFLYVQKWTLIFQRIQNQAKIWYFQRQFSQYDITLLVPSFAYSMVLIDLVYFPKLAFKQVSLFRLILLNSWWCFLFYQKMCTLFQKMRFCVCFLKMFRPLKRYMFYCK